jgi:hypothetical protein
MFGHDAIQQRLAEIRRQQRECDKTIAHGKPDEAKPGSSNDLFEIEIGVNTAQNDYDAAVKRREALDREEQRLLRQLDSSSAEVKLDDSEFAEESLDEIPLIVPEEKADTSAAFHEVAGMLITGELLQMKELSKRYARLHQHIATINGILEGNQTAYDKLNELHTLLSNPRIRAEIIGTVDVHSPLTGKIFLRKLIYCMMAIDKKLTGFTLPDTRESFDERAVKKLQDLTTTFYEKLLPKVSEALAELPDDLLMSLGEMQEVKQNNGGKANRFLFLVEHQFKHENEPWRFTINLDQLQAHLKRFESSDQYLIKKLAAVIHITKVLNDPTLTSSAKVENLKQYLAMPANKKTLLAHRSSVRSALSSLKTTASDDYVNNMEITIATADRIGHIIEQSAKPGRQPR